MSLRATQENDYNRINVPSDKNEQLETDAIRIRNKAKQI